MPTRVEKGNVTAAAAASIRLREAVASGDLKPDQPIYENEWAEKLGLSRTPVHEAIQDLVVRGMAVRRGRTAYVFKPSLIELLEIYDIRTPLERLASERCVLNATSETVSKVSLAYSKIAQPRHDTGWFTDHETFHEEIFRGSNMPRLVETIMGLRAQSAPYVRFVVNIEHEFRTASSVQHAQMLDAVITGNVDAMSEVVEDHLARTRNKITEFIETYGTTISTLL